MNLNMIEVIEYYKFLVSSVRDGDEVKPVYNALAICLHNKYEPVDVSLFDNVFAEFLHQLNELAYKEKYIDRVTFDKIHDGLPIVSMK